MLFICVIGIIGFIMMWAFIYAFVLYGIWGEEEIFDPNYPMIDRDIRE